MNSMFNSHKSLIENNIQTLFAATGRYNCVKKIIVAKYDCLCVLILVWIIKRFSALLRTRLDPVVSQWSVDEVRCADVWSAGVLRLGALRGLESGVLHDAGTHVSAQLVKKRRRFWTWSAEAAGGLTNTLMNLRPCVTDGSSITVLLLVCVNVFL